MTQLDDVIRQLQFDRITGQLTGLTQSRPGGELAARLVPSFEWAEVGQWLDETGEGLKVLSRYDPYLAEVSDICDLAVQAEKGGVLSGAELIRVRGVLSAAARLRRWLKDDLGDVPRVAARLTCLSACPDLAESIDQAIDGDGEIKDSASPQLARLRSAIAAQAGRIRNKLDEMVRSPSWQRWLQEPIYTMRNQRFVLPVKAEHRRSVRGIIHDQSASGATLFIEPE
ncbi:MAG: endonuclease MutS2, partial [Negativicutes bacterium]|nr:endonuclease MutS2 [Negativicutes bacterium]